MNIRRTYVPAIITAFFLACSCSTIVDVGSRDPDTARLVVQYATLKVIDGDPDRAARVASIVDRLQELAGADEAVTVETLDPIARALVPWDDLDAADRLLVNALIHRVSVELTKRAAEIGGDGRLPLAELGTVLGWVRTAALLEVDAP